MNANDVVGIKQFFSSGGIQALLVSYFRIDAIVGAAVSIDTFARDFHEWFGAGLLTTWLYQGATYDRTVVENLNGSMDFGDYSKVIQGFQVGAPAPSFVALDIKQNVSNRMTRGGRKRLPFIIEEMTNGNAEAMGGAGQTALESFFGLPSNVPQYQDNTGLNFVSIVPVIVGRIESPVGSGKYVLDPSRVNPVVSANLVKVTSQTSRKS